MFKSGRWRAEKIKYPDGIGGCIWLVIDENDDSFGLCLDFELEDIPHMISVLEQARDGEAEEYIEEE